MAYDNKENSDDKDIVESLCFLREPVVAENR
jgi:hypothetical protein